MASNQARFEKLIGSINKRFDRAARKWQPGGTSDWQEEMSDILYSGHAGAWRIGANQAGGQASRAEIAAAASQAADEQSFYLNRFSADLIAGKYVDDETGDIDHDGISARAQMYSGAMRGTANLSWINYSDDDDEFDWVLGAVEDHCDDCPYLAEGSPYTKDSLPTVPGENQTPCLFHCKCHLRRRDGAKSIEPIGSGALGESEDPPRLGDKQTEYFEVPIDTTPAKLAKRIRAEMTEVSAVFSRDGSLLSVPHRGSAAEVEILTDEMDLIRNSIWIHNHPQGSPPSRWDLVAAETYNPAEMWVSSKKGVLRLIRPEDGWPSRALLEAAYVTARANAAATVSAEEGLSNKARQRRLIEQLGEDLSAELGKLGVEVKLDDHP